jgi:phosphomannomutase
LAYYLLLDSDGPRLRGAVYETAVTTLAVEKIAERAGCTPRRSDLLVGFKYIGHQVAQYQRDHQNATDEELLSFATEESHGYLDTPNIRDKDAMSGALYLAKLHEKLTNVGETLVDYLANVYSEVGRFGDTGRSIIILGSRGFKAIHAVMTELRRIRPERLAGVRIERIIDRRDPEYGPKDTDTDWEARNLLTYWFNGGRISFRPSGTEPKLKFYVQTQGGSASTDAQGFANEIAGEVYQELLRILNDVYKPVELDNAFAWLPDVIPLDGKVRLQDYVARELQSQIAQEDLRIELTARWLEEQVALLVPGESAWEATEQAFRSEASRWSRQEAERVDHVFTYLRDQT